MVSQTTFAKIEATVQRYSPLTLNTRIDNIIAMKTRVIAFMVYNEQNQDYYFVGMYERGICISFESVILLYTGKGCGSSYYYSN